MTLDEAKEAGDLVDALIAMKTTQADFRRGNWHTAHRSNLVGVGLSIEHSDSGSEGLGPDVCVPPDMAQACMAHLRELIEARLIELGVTP